MSRTNPIVVALVAPNDDSPPGLEALADGGTLRVVHDAKGLGPALDGADILAVYDFRTTALAEVADRVADLEWIHAASAGVDAVLIPEVVAGPTLVTNAQGVFDETIAEWVLAVLLVFAKDLIGTIDRQRHRVWEHRESDRLAGRRVLVVGAGSIGRAIARQCRAAGMTVRGVARRARTDDPDFDEVAAATDLHDALGWADDVVAATPLTPDTLHLFDAEAFAAMRPGARFVNIGRGPVVDEPALIDALDRGHVGGAALDVFEHEPLPEDHPFWDLPQVVVSPHMSGDVVGWQAALGAQFVANVRRWQAGEPLHHAVDKHALAPKGRP